MRKTVFAATLAGLCWTAIAAEAAKPLEIPSADKKAKLSLQLPEGWKSSVAKDGTVTLDMPKCGVHIQVWALGEASVDAAVTKAAELIKGEVTKFKVTESKDISVDGVAGKQLIGTGEEADDGDPANADVYVFVVDGKVYMICAHGEGEGSVKSRPALAGILAAIKKS